MAEHTAALSTVLDYASAGALLRERFFSKEATRVVNIGLRMAYALARGNKLLFCGNGGSAADAQHLAAEFVNRFVLDRPPLAALALTTDTSALTAIANDFGFEEVFAKQVAALGAPGDILVAISTSGNSPSIIKAMRTARERSLITIGLTGNKGGAMPPLCDYMLCVDEPRTALVQEIHIAVGHLLCALTDHYLFENVAALNPYLEGTLPLPE